MAYTDITFMRVRRSLIHSAKYAMHVYGGIFEIPNYHIGMNLGIPQLGKDVVLTPRSIWYHRSIWIIWLYIFREELSFALSFYRLKLDPVFPACNLFDGFQSAKLTTLCSGTGHQ